MHEYSITTSIIDILEEIGRKNKLKKIETVNFELNPIASIEPESIRFYFDYLTGKNKLLKGAKLVFKSIELEMRCLDCNDTFKKKEFRPLCPNCGSSNISIPETEDLKIISVET
jgi:hydrogenase nickel incorporation protein HypA/HybF